MQLKGVNLIVEAHLYLNETGLAKTYILDRFQPMIKEQVETFLDCVAYLVFNAHPVMLEKGKGGVWSAYSEECFKIGYQIVDLPADLFLI